jgi:hypothetical protein
MIAVVEECHAQGPRVASHLVRTCCVHYSDERIDLPASVHAIARGGLRLLRGDSALERRLGSRIQPFRGCSGFTRVAARTRGTRSTRVSIPEASTGRSPSPSLRSLPRRTDTSWDRILSGCVD